jgi:hypothetical protein
VKLSICAKEQPENFKNFGKQLWPATLTGNFDRQLWPSNVANYFGYLLLQATLPCNFDRQL